MKREIKSILFVSLPVMGQPTSFSPICTPLDIPLDVCIDVGISDSISVVDDSISFM